MLRLDLAEARTAWIAEAAGDKTLAERAKIGTSWPITTETTA
jgi:hypothetical protein